MNYIKDILQQLSMMKWTDYLDILIVAFLLFKLIPMFRSTNALRVARSIIAIIVVAWLTEVLELHSLSFIFNQFLQVGILALVILFQPELRRMLDQLSSVRLRKLLGTEKREQDMELAISQIVQACEVMGRERVGALIVMARNERLDEYFKKGTKVDAQISEQLIRNIFFPKASLHDGAMIILEGRIAAAGCVLPLSQSDRLSADLGTRHRAGVGISEVSDAVAIIVSEETGTISVAVGGMLKRHLAPQTLEKLLCNELCPKEPTAENNLAVRLRQKLKKKEDQTK
ncbi:MAG: diadenylate cyclase CdaA [Oscillospiraceae bacterium]|nr:diadenylate cyclase CdaA [Oscillospiraceae bacterium]